MNMTLPVAQAVLRQYLEDRRASARTIQNYVGALPRLEREVGMLFGPEVEAQAALERWRAELRRRYDRDLITGDKIRCDVAMLRALYGALIKAKLYTANPAATIASMSRTERLPRPMPIDQLELLLAQIPLGTVEQLNHTGLRDRTMIEMFYNGVRNSEVCAMHTDNVSYADKEQTVVLRFVGKGGHEGEVVLNKRSGRFLALHMLEQFAAAEWREWLTDFPVGADHPDQAVFQALGRLLDKRLRGVSAPLFLTGGRQFGRRDANKMFERYRKAAGLPDSYGPHSLRHTCATELLESGEDLRVVQEILRHRSIRTTVLYTQVRRGPKAVAIEKLPVLSGGGRLW
jgi:site-specific recombinase XerD